MSSWGKAKYLVNRLYLSLFQSVGTSKNALCTLYDLVDLQSIYVCLVVAKAEKTDSLSLLNQRASSLKLRLTGNVFMNNLYAVNAPL